MKLPAIGPVVELRILRIVLVSRIPPANSERLRHLFAYSVDFIMWSHADRLSFSTYQVEWKLYSFNHVCLPSFHPATCHSFILYLSILSTSLLPSSCMTGSISDTGTNTVPTCGEPPF